MSLECRIFGLGLLQKSGAKSQTEVTRTLEPAEVMCALPAVDTGGFPCRRFHRRTSTDKSQMSSGYFDMRALSKRRLSLGYIWNQAILTISLMQKNTCSIQPGSKSSDALPAFLFMEFYCPQSSVYCLHAAPHASKGNFCGSSAEGLRKGTHLHPFATPASIQITLNSDKVW